MESIYKIQMRTLVAALALILLMEGCHTNEKKEKKMYFLNSVNKTKSEGKAVPNLAGIRSFLKTNKQYQDSFVFVINMKTPSRSFRFFIVDLKDGKIIDNGMVAHGINSQKGVDDELVFSNELNSGCSSLGKYRIGEKYRGRFGDAYKLYGLDSSNSNAFRRAIVLHKYQEVPDAEQPSQICYSLGCPMVSPNFFRKIQEKVDNSSKLVLLDIIY